MNEGNKEMVGNELVVDVIYSPWCFCEVLEESYKRALVEKWKIKIGEFNMWEIDDNQLDSLPRHISRTIKNLRDPNNLEHIDVGGGVFFLNGKKLDLSATLKWPQIEKILEESRRKEK